MAPKISAAPVLGRAEDSHTVIDEAVSGVLPSSRGDCGSTFAHSTRKASDWVPTGACHAPVPKRMNVVVREPPGQSGKNEPGRERTAAYLAPPGRRVGRAKVPV